MMMTNCKFSLTMTKCYFKGAFNKMFEAISNQHYIKVNSKYINKNNHSYETIQSIIDKHMNKNR